jgi:tetratricopeptide (TPR) repeat protein
MKKIFLLLFLLSALCSFSQSEVERGLNVLGINAIADDTSTIYALVVGVSRYEDPSMPQLQYADSDAVYFAKFIRSGAMGKTDSSNIKLLINENATDNNIKRDRQYILRRVKTGERVYIYLSGHGDAINTEAIYFLSHNTPKVSDKSEYTAVSNINMLEMHSIIKMFIEKGARVFLISDFCRTNELVGKSTASRFLYTNVMGQEIPGLTKMVSCSADEFSFEDKKWGNGRGVFSFYLINGLLGLADNEATPDGKVSLQELKTYVEHNVGADTKSPTTGEPRQTPDFKGEKQTLCRVNDKVKSALIAQKGNNSDYLAMATKGSAVNDATDTALYQKFIAAINDERLIEPDGNNAKFFLDLLLKKSIGEITRADLTDIFIAAVLDKGQKPINYYSKGLLDSIKFSYEYFYDASKYFEAALKHLNRNPELYKTANASRLFLEARAMKESRGKKDWQRGLLLADSALAIKQWAYLYHTKGLLLEKQEKRNEALLSYKIAAIYAAEWVFPINAIGTIYNELGKYDSAEVYYKRAIQTDSNYYAVYDNLAGNFTAKGLPDSAEVYFRKAVKIKPDFAEGYYSLAKNFSEKGLEKPQYYDSATYYYTKAVVTKPDYYDAYINMGVNYATQQLYDSAAACYLKAIAIQQGRWEACYNLAGVYAIQGDKADAIKYFKLAITNGFSDWDFAVKEDTDLMNVREQLTDLRKTMEKK